jgi:hypothetical protein
MIQEGSISTTMGEYSPFFDIHHNELYFMRRTPGRLDYTIYKSTLTTDGWTKPEVASFSGTYRDAAPYLSPDGNTLFFDSRRPSANINKSSINLWVTKRQSDSWSQPKLIEASINTPDEPETGVDEYGPAVDAQGVLYFYSFRQPYRGGRHYKVNPSDYSKAILNTNLPDPSYKTFVSYAYISPNGKFVLLEGRGINSSKTDLYYSCKTSEDIWSSPIALESINTIHGEGVASMTADGKFLLFASDRTTDSKNASYSNLYITETKGLFGKCQKSFFE